MSKSIGVIIVLLSTLFYATLPPLLKKTNQTIAPFTVMAISMFVLFALSLLFSLLFEKNALKGVVEDKSSLSILVLVGALNTVAFWLAIKGYKFMPLWQQSLIDLLRPIFIAVFAYLILKEVLSFQLFLGLVIMGLGLFIALR